jgi:hypothetical protein
MFFLASLHFLKDPWVIDYFLLFFFPLIPEVGKTRQDDKETTTTLDHMARSHVSHRHDFPPSNFGP